jgi:HEAT repeat protein
MILVRKFSVTAAVLLFIFLLPNSLTGFLIGSHRDITDEAIQALMSEDVTKDWDKAQMTHWDVSNLVKGSGDEDLVEGGLPFMRAPYNPMAHFDNDPDYRSVCNNFAILNQLIESNLRAKSRDPWSFGTIIHGIEDFYSHSNYVELYELYAKNHTPAVGPPPPIEEVWSRPTDYADFIHLLEANLHTGRYPDSEFPPADNDHGFPFVPVFGGMNADSRMRGAPYVKARQVARKAATWYLRLYAGGEKRVQEWTQMKRACIGVTLKPSEEAVVDSLIKQIRTSTDPKVRASNALMLGLIGNPRSIDTLALMLLHDPNTLVRRQVAKALALFRTEPAAQALLRAFDSTQPLSVQTEEVRALGSYPSEQTKEALVHLLKSPSGPLKVAALRALVFQNDVKLTPEIEHLLKDPQVTVAERAAWALGELRNKSSVASLISVLETGRNSDLRAVSALALGRISDLSAVRVLGSAAQDPEQPLYVRTAAIRALGLFPLENVSTWLTPLLKDNNEQIRASASYILGTLNDSTSIPYAQELLKSGSASAKKTILVLTDLRPEPFYQQLLSLAVSPTETKNSRLFALNSLAGAPAAQSEEVRAQVRRLVSLTQPIEIQSGAVRFLSTNITTDDIVFLKQFSERPGLNPHVRIALLTEVPYLVGKKIDEARKLLKQSGLVIASTRRIPQETEEGSVRLQIPGVGDLRHFGYGVDLYVSSGPSPPDAVPVPSLLGMKREDAEKLLEDRKLIGNKNPAYGDCEPGDQVVAQIPEPETEQQPSRIERQGTIYFFVSDGRPWPVRDFRGRDTASVRRELNNETQTRFFYDFEAIGESTGPYGIISRQEPAGFATAPCGAWVYLHYRPE